jgi:hypothetical protein
MRVQLVSGTYRAQNLALRSVAIIFLLASLMIGTAWPMPASGQAAPSAGMGATSPLAMRSARPAGIPLGATEITTPGISPAVFSGSKGMTACGAPVGSSSSALLFDGGGLSRKAPLSCADSQLYPSFLPLTSSARRAGIPLGATDLGVTGLSVAAQVPRPNAESEINPAGIP